MIKEVSVCEICKSPFVLSVLESKSLPLTGIFVSKPTEEKAYDQHVWFCKKCSHAQLFKVISPHEVYGDTYSHRSGGSEISRKGNKAFASFIKEVLDGTRKSSVLDIGCNDGNLLRELEGVAIRRTGIDPSVNDFISADGIKIKKMFIENLSPDEIAKNDLIVSSHTFEHVAHPMEQWKKIIENAPMNATFFMEVPSLDSMVINCRWDQVFHQHLHYFSLTSISEMISRCGATVISHRINTDYWGGTMMVAFEKGSEPYVEDFELPSPTFKEVATSTYAYYSQAANIRHTLSVLKENGETIAGFGGAQMYPTLDHAVKLSSFISEVYDDNKERHGLSWPGENKPIIKAPPSDLSDVNIVITAPDSARAIIKRCIELKAKRIITTTQVH